MTTSNKEVVLLSKSLGLSRREALELIKSGEYLVLSDSDADEKCRELILETVWSFNPAFLAGHLKNGVSQEVIELIQSNGRCESNNEAILSLIDDVDNFVNDAIACDGRGHFMAHYDHEEIDLGNNYYAYRLN
jgi:hypothetical protein